ncbi:MAG: hypothetical protein ACWGQW_00465 [bacterium]
MEEKVLVDSKVEKLKLTWDGERFAFVHDDDVLILSPKEMYESVHFALPILHEFIKTNIEMQELMKKAAEGRG